jgi:FtsP/CotA-like multicopper oxidase with cupredoxin domain
MIRSTALRAALAVAVAVAVAVAPTACGGDEDGAAAPTSAPAATTTSTASPGTSSTLAPASTTTTEAVRLVEVTFAGGQVAGGAQRPTVSRGEKVRIRVTSDVADEVHVHTYDLRAAVGPGQAADLDFVASIPGRHEVELEKKRKQLLVLEVR